MLGWVSSTWEGCRGVSSSPTSSEQCGWLAVDAIAAVWPTTLWVPLARREKSQTPRVLLFGVLIFLHQTPSFKSFVQNAPFLCPSWFLLSTMVCA